MVCVMRDKGIAPFTAVKVTLDNIKCPPDTLKNERETTVEPLLSGHLLSGHPP